MTITSTIKVIHVDCKLLLLSLLLIQSIKSKIIVPAIFFIKLPITFYSGEEFTNSDALPIAKAIQVFFLFCFLILS